MAESSESADERMLTVQEVAQRLHISTRTVLALIQRGELEAVRVGRSVRIEPAALRAYIERNRYEPDEHA